jgi:hypothetical protein
MQRNIGEPEIIGQQVGMIQRKKFVACRYFAPKINKPKSINCPLKVIFDV